MGGSLGGSKSDSDMKNKSMAEAAANSASNMSSNINNSLTSNLASNAMGGSTGANQSQFQQNVWSPQSQALSQLYGNMSGLFGPTVGDSVGQIPGAVAQQVGVFDQATPAWQQQMGGGAYQGMNLQDQYNRALSGGGNEQFINESIMGGSGNNYVDAMKQQMQADSDKRLGRSLAMNDARAAGYQQSGSSRHGLTESRLYEDSNDALTDAQTSLGYNTFDKDLDRKLGIAQRADQFDMGRLNNISGMIGGQQNAMQGGLNYGANMQNLGMGQFNPYMAPIQGAGQMTQMYGQPTVLGSGSGSAYSDAYNQANATSNTQADMVANQLSNAIANMTSKSKGQGSGDSSAKGLGFGGK